MWPLKLIVSKEIQFHSLAQKLLKDPNILKFTKVKSMIFLMNHITASTTDQYSCDGRTALQDSCFLKSCFFCKKPLRLDKEVYMYGGELGFCSVDCRNKQIYLDEMKNIETHTKTILASIHQRQQAGQCSENTVLSEDCRQRGKPLSCTKNRVTFTISSSINHQ
ncbi:FCS-Like Zinc finger 17-like [Lycium ferocissimum]|uniref:FCS-Like Zinc finger 17-like n=1 Tax=Lycium ferocissimum TaxID=112874 RepID=UPI0028161325|nr:FCS-Like Zinc finger 17-like [Lycium ferocissimum]